MKTNNWNSVRDRLIDPPEPEEHPCPRCGSRCAVVNECAGYSVTIYCEECEEDSILPAEDEREPDDGLGAYDPPMPDVGDEKGGF